MTMPRRRRRSCGWSSLSLVVVALLCLQARAAKNNSAGDDSKSWGLPGKQKSNNKRSRDSRKNSSNRRKNNGKNKNDKNKLPDPNDDDNDDDGTQNHDEEEVDSSKPFQTSFTFFPQSDLTSPSSLEALLGSSSSNSGIADDAKKAAIKTRLQSFVRERMMDHEEVEKQVNRSRKEWEDMNVEQHMKVIEAFMKLGSLILSSPPIKKLMSSREAQESLRQFVLSIKLLLEDPDREFVLGDSDRWHAMFDKLKQWEGASQDRLLEILIEYLEHRSDNE